MPPFDVLYVSFSWHILFILREISNCDQIITNNENVRPGKKSNFIRLSTLTLGSSCFDINI